jgi:hypothetical protein
MRRPLPLSLILLLLATLFFFLDRRRTTIGLTVGRNLLMARDDSKEENPSSLTAEDNNDKADQFKKYREKYNYSPPNQVFSGSAPECGAGSDYGDFFKLSAKERSRYNEDKIIFETFFKDINDGGQSVHRVGGTYIELGAFDGQTESNSRFFDLCLGWKGLLIEGNPSTYEKTLQARPQAHRMSFAPSCKDEDSTAQFYSYPMANSGLEGRAKTYQGKPLIQVPCGPLGPVLEDMFQGETIDFFSLDVEGAEPMVLETIDFNKVKIDVLMIEVKNNHCQKVCKSRDETRAIMQKAGYKRLEGLVPASDVYVHPQSKLQMMA